MQEKSHLRTKFKELRKNLNTKEVSVKIRDNIRQFDLYKNAENVMIYYPTVYEIDLLELMEDDKKFYFPRVSGDDLMVCPYDDKIKFEKSSFNIYEPCSNPVESDILDLIFVPALAVDKEGFRLGYGGGFYDRFLFKCPDLAAVVPIYDEFIVERLPVESFDKKVNHIITNGKRLTVK